MISNNPIDLLSVFTPNEIDWRVDMGEITILTLQTYFDKRYAFRDDVERI